MAKEKPYDIQKITIEDLREQRPDLIRLIRAEAGLEGVGLSPLLTEMDQSIKETDEYLERLREQEGDETVEIEEEDGESLSDSFLKMAGEDSLWADEPPEPPRPAWCG